MKLDYVCLENFRGFESLNLCLNGESAILYGENGAGKSSILRGIALLLSNIVYRSTSWAVKQQMGFDGNDVRVGTDKLSLSGLFDVGSNDKLQCGFSYQPGHIQEDASLDSFKALFEKLCRDENAGLPVFAYYGVNRAATTVPLRGKVPQGKLATYKGALGQSTFRSFFEWFRAQEDIEIEEREARQDPDYQDLALRAVRTAIYASIPAISDLKVCRSPLRLSLMKNGQQLFAEHLSDGERCTLALIGDIARRLAIANPHLEDSLQGDGIVLIDEVELHLYPAGQHSICRLLRNTFPNIQFVLTTQSPVVLGETGKDYNVFRVGSGGEVEPRDILFCDANMVLEREMGVSQINSAIKELETLVMLYAMAGELYLTERASARLNALTGGTSEAITEAAMIVSRVRKGGKPASVFNLEAEDAKLNGLVVKPGPVIHLPQERD